MRRDGKETRIDFPYEFPGFQFEIQEVERCVKAGRLESEVMPLALSIQAASVMDEIYANTVSYTDKNVEE